MEKKCCDLKVTELDNGYRIEITGEAVKDKCKVILENCCSKEHIKKCFDNCCG